MDSKKIGRLADYLTEWNTYSYGPLDETTVDSDEWVSHIARTEDMGAGDYKLDLSFRWESLNLLHAFELKVFFDDVEVEALAFSQTALASNQSQPFSAWAKIHGVLSGEHDIRVEVRTSNLLGTSKISYASYCLTKI